MVFVTGLNIFMGYAGQVSFGHNAFAAIGGYASAMLTADARLGAAAALPRSAISRRAHRALIVGYPTLRLRGHYLAMATLAIGLIVYEVAVQWQSVTQGYMGISGIPPLGIGRFELTVRPRNSHCPHRRRCCSASWIAHRHPALALRPRLRAIAGSEDAAHALGIDVARYKLAAFLISAFYASVAGSLFVHVVGFVSPEVFGLHMVMLAFTMLYRRRHRHDLRAPHLGALSSCDPARDCSARFKEFRTSPMARC